MTGEEKQSGEGGLGVAGAGEKLRGIERRQLRRQFLRLKFASGERNEIVGLRL